MAPRHLASKHMCNKAPYTVGLYLLAVFICLAHDGAQGRVIDGSKTPALIPDSVAYRYFFGAVSEPPNASAEQRKRQAAKLVPASLTNEELQTAYVILAESTLNTPIGKRATSQPPRIKKNSVRQLITRAF